MDSLLLQSYLERGILGVWNNLKAHQLSTSVLEFSLVERVASLGLQATEDKVLTVYDDAPNSSSDYPTFLEFLDGVLEGVPSGIPWFSWRTSMNMWAMKVSPRGEWMEGMYFFYLNLVVRLLCKA